MPAGVALKVVPTSAKIVVHPARIGIKTGLLVANITQNIGGSGAQAFNFTSSTTWTINHNNGRTSSVQTFNAGGVEVFGDVTNTSINQLTVNFLSPVSGTAIVT